MGLELSEFEITFNARTTVKEQALTDSVTNSLPFKKMEAEWNLLTPNMESIR